MQQDGDELPVAWTGNTREKYIHAVGSVGKVSWKSSGDHSYTGIFEGANYGIVRLSLASEPDEAVVNTAPGMGLKFLRDGIESSSLVAMFSVDGQESWNFFANDFQNHIPSISGPLVALAAKFATATWNIAQVGVSDWAEKGEDGVPRDNVNLPYKLVFRPTGEISFPDSYHGLFTDDLATIAEGSVLYNIFAWDAPVELGGQEQQIGELVLDSILTTSLWGDTHLFYRHQDMRQDIENYHPEWDQYTEQFSPHMPQECEEARK